MDYKVGSVSDILAQSCDSATLDPVLVDIFGTQKYKATSSNVSVKSPKTKIKKEKVDKVIKKKVKRKIETEEPTIKEEEDDPPKKKKKKLTPTPEIKEEPSAEVVGKKKKLTKKLKEVKAKKSKESERAKDNERIIEDFEKEFQDDSDIDDNSEDSDDEAKKVKESTDKPKKIANFQLNTPKDKNPDHESRTVFVGNVPTTLKERQLRRIFKSCGSIETVRFRGGTGEKVFQLKKVAINSKKLNPNQYNLLAYIRYKTREEAEKAVVELNGHEVNEHHLMVDLADNSKQRRRDNKKCVFVGNLPYKIKDDEVLKYFQDCGKVISVRIVRDRLTSLSKGFAYVNFEVQDSVSLALQKSGSEFQGRPIRVTKAVKKLKKPKVMNEAQKRKAGNVVKTEKNYQTNNKTFNSKNDSNPVPVPLPQGKSANALRRLEMKKKKQTLAEEDKFSGDKVAGKKKKYSKPNRGDLRKASIANQLTGISTTQVKKTREQMQKKKRF